MTLNQRIKTHEYFTAHGVARVGGPLFCILNAEITRFYTCRYYEQFAACIVRAIFMERFKINWRLQFLRKICGIS
jgi:hypothetical protein